MIWFGVKGCISETSLLTSVSGRLFRNCVIIHNPVRNLSSFPLGIPKTLNSAFWRIVPIFPKLHQSEAPPVDWKTTWCLTLITWLWFNPFEPRRSTPWTLELLQQNSYHYPKKLSLADLVLQWIDGLHQYMKLSPNCQITLSWLLVHIGMYTGIPVSLLSVETSTLSKIINTCVRKRSYIVRNSVDRKIAHLWWLDACKQWTLYTIVWNWSEGISNLIIPKFLLDFVSYILDTLTVKDFVLTFQVQLKCSVLAR